MRDPMSWSLPFGRLFGIQMRMHVLLPLIFIGLIARAATSEKGYSGTWTDMAMLLGLLFISVLLHEFGHCFGARLAEGDATEILMWPLGGLAYCDVPHTPRANFICVIAGPLVNVVLCLLSGIAIILISEPTVRPPWNPLWYPFRDYAEGAITLISWAGDAVPVPQPPLIILARLFYVNMILFLFNIVLVGFPMDSGRILQCILWRYLGYHKGTMIAVMAGFVTAIIVGICGIATNEWLLLGLALFIYISCRHQWIVLEMGGEDALFGYDFSQGYTSLEREQATPPPRRRPNWFQRWRQRRSQLKILRVQEQHEAEERRLDEVLQKIQREGMAALTDEERRFLKRASDHRNRQ